MKRYIKQINITVKISAESASDSNYKFIQEVINHINLTTGGEIIIMATPKSLIKEPLEELPF